MLFNSAVFAFFFAAVLVGCCLLRARGARKSLLLVASYLFYANWDWRYLSLLLLSTGVDFVAARRMHASDSAGRRRAWLLVSLVTNLGVLALFKYGNFLVEQLGPLLDSLELVRPHLADEIPVGISFYTFQTLSYSIDVYRRRTEPCPSVLDFALFVSFFAQLVAGPIVRSTEFLPQLKTFGTPRARELSAGLQRFVLGLFKKVVIADNAGLFVDSVFSSPDAHGAPVLWCAMYAFALQIYCDFSAYTDMALGIGRALGFKLPENFDAPYLSASITEFWRRWHMSLSRWLRDYLYIPLGGSRGGALATYRNLMLTMLLGGLWHGAAWSFVIWGGVHGLLLAVERLLGLGGSPAASERRGPIGRLLRVVLTFHLVGFAWVVFRGAGAERIGTYLSRMFSAWSGDDADALGTGLLWASVLLLLSVGQALSRARQWRVTVWERLPGELQGMALALLLLAASAFHVDQVAFLYFQF